MQKKKYGGIIAVCVMLLSLCFLGESKDGIMAKATQEDTFQIRIGTLPEDQKQDDLHIPLFLLDRTGTYQEDGSQLVAEEIIVKVGGMIPSRVTKRLSYLGQEGKEHHYEVTLQGIRGNGWLSLEIPAGSVENAASLSNRKIVISTSIWIDHMAPSIIMDSYATGTNQGYMSQEDTVSFRLAVVEAGGFAPETVSGEMIEILVNGAPVQNVEKEWQWIEKKGIRYVYELQVKQITGNGKLSIRIANNQFQDEAGHGNVGVQLPVMAEQQQVMIDNEKPVLSLLAMTGETWETLYEGNWTKEGIKVTLQTQEQNEIAQYQRATEEEDFTTLSAEYEIWKTSMNQDVTYRAMDMAGNLSEPATISLKIDCEKPNQPVLLCTEQREGGIPYQYSATNDSPYGIYVKANTLSFADLGEIQSGINMVKEKSYYTITRYQNREKGTVLDTQVLSCQEGKFLQEDGYYEVQMIVEDMAGNQAKSEVSQISIQRTEGTVIRITNLEDADSGIERATIHVYHWEENTNQKGREALSAIVIEHPYREIVRTIPLESGKFWMEVVLEDKAGNTTTLETAITVKETTTEK